MILPVDLIIDYEHMLLLSQCHGQRKIDVLAAIRTQCILNRKVLLVQLDEVVLNLDELEAIRLADYEGRITNRLPKTNISRPTFGRDSWVRQGGKS